MKALLIIIICTLSVAAHGQEFGVVAGGTRSSFENVDNAAGAFVGVRISNEIQNRTIFNGEIVYSYESLSNKEQNENISSALAMFYFKVYPTKHNFSLMAGVIGQYVIDGKVSPETGDALQSGHAGLLTGIGYDIKKFDISFRFTPYVDNSTNLRHSFQLGVGYSF